MQRSLRRDEPMSEDTDGPIHRWTSLDVRIDTTFFGEVVGVLRRPAPHAGGHDQHKQTQFDRPRQVAVVSR